MLAVFGLARESIRGRRAGQRCIRAAQERGRSQHLHGRCRTDNRLTKSRPARQHFSWWERIKEVQTVLLPSEGNEVREDECWEVIASS